MYIIFGTELNTQFLTYTITLIVAVALFGLEKLNMLKK